MQQPRDGRGRFAHNGPAKVYEFVDPQIRRHHVEMRKRFKFRDEWERYLLRTRLNAPESLVDKAYNPSQPRDKIGRWTSSGAGLAANRALTQGGFTIHPRSNDEPSEGYALSKWPERSLVMPASGTHPARIARSIRRWLSDNSDMLDDPKMHIGGWLDSESGNLYIDFSVVYPKSQRTEAVRDAKEANQKAIWSLHDMEEINTGGTGEAIGKAKPRDRFFIPTAGKDIDELTDQVMEMIGLSIPDDDEDDE